MHLEKRVNSYSACIYGSYSCWRKHNHALGRNQLQITQKRSFPGSGLAGYEQVFIGLLNKVKSQLQLGIRDFLGH
jgi:hypothetical protein